MKNMSTLIPENHTDTNQAQPAGLSYDGPVTSITRTPLSRERIIEAAVMLADENGIEELSMRRLADEFGVGPMALYNHVENKEDIHDGMIDHVFSEITLPEEREDWKTFTRVVGRSAIEVFGKHSWVVLLLMRTGNFGPGALLFMDTVLGVLRGAGFSDETTHHAWQMLASHTMGYSFQQATNPGLVEKELAHIQLAILQAGDQLPHVVALAPLIAECDFESEYMYGLEIILDGLESRLA